MSGKKLIQSSLSTCNLCGSYYIRKTSKAAYCCPAHRQRAYRLRKAVVALQELDQAGNVALRKRQKRHRNQVK